MTKKSSEIFYNWYLGVLTTLVALPILAPVLLKLGLIFPAKIIYFIYSFFCHQFATRSIHLFDYQYAWCARDAGIWAGVAFVAWALKYNKIKPIKWYWVIPFAIPIGLDGGIQTVFTMLNLSYKGGLMGIPVYSSNDLVRFLTGAFFGIGLSLWISGTFAEDLTENKEVTFKSRVARYINNSQIKKIAIFMGILLSFYLVSVAFWQHTSEKVYPTDFADSAVKLQDSNFFERRANGICPTESAEDLFAVDCFFK